MNQNKFGEETMIVKVRYTNNGEMMARKIVIDKDTALEDFELKLRERFDIDHDKAIDIYYLDDDKDRIAISFEDEFALSLENNKVLSVFEIVVKPNDIDSLCTYPRIQKGKPGECVDILVESQFLTIANAKRDDTTAWGTYSYTNDSDIVKVLAHSGKVDLPDVPPSYNIIVSIRFVPGNLKYIGTTSHEVTTLSYGPHDSSYIIEGVRTAPIIKHDIEI